MKLKRERKKVSLERSTTDISYCIISIFIIIILLVVFFFLTRVPKSMRGVFAAT